MSSGECLGLGYELTRLQHIHHPTDIMVRFQTLLPIPRRLSHPSFVDAGRLAAGRSHGLAHLLRLLAGTFPTLQRDYHEPSPSCQRQDLNFLFRRHRIKIRRNRRRESAFAEQQLELSARRLTFFFHDIDEFSDSHRSSFRGYILNTTVDLLHLAAPLDACTGMRSSSV